MKDSMVQKVIDKMEIRSIGGIHKYGTTMDRDDLSTLDWLRHAQEESMDFSIYLQKLITLYEEYERNAMGK